MGRNKGNVSPSLMGFSIEGGTMDREGMNLNKSLARDCAVTVKPANKTCIAEILEDENTSLFKNEDQYIETLIKKEEGQEFLDLVKADYPPMQKPKMNSEQAQKEFGKVTVKDSAQQNFGSVKVKNDSGSEISPKNVYGSKPKAKEAQPIVNNQHNIEAKKTTMEKENEAKSNPFQEKQAQPNQVDKKPELSFSDKMSQTHKDIIPKEHPNRKQMIQHIYSKHREGNTLEARRLYDRFISGGGSFTSGTDFNKVASKLGKNEELDKSSYFGYKKEDNQKRK